MLRSQGRYQEALDLDVKTLADQRELLGEQHPSLTSGSRAAELSERARDALAADLGGDHPAVLCAGINLANAYGELGLHDRAERGERLAVEGLRRRFGADHPDVLVGTGNLAITLRAVRRQEEAEQLQRQAESRATRLLGDAHPATESIRAWRRVGRDLEPQQI